MPRGAAPDHAMEKTGKEFWEKFWADLKLPQTVDPSFKNDRVISDVLKENLPRGTGKVAAEIGCAPGKWLVFLSKEMGYRVEGYEYVQAAAEVSRRNLAACGLPEGSWAVHTADFLSVEAPGKYDLVISLGFVEHFEEFDDIFARHLSMVRPGGYLVLGVPRFKGLNFPLAAFVDIWRRPGILPAHNLAVMEPEVFREAAVRHGLRLKFCDYVGGFEPALFDAAALPFPPLRLAFKALLRICGLIFRGNSFLASSYVMAVYSRPDSQ